VRDCKHARRRPAGADVVKFDLSLGRISVACSSGFISVFQAEGGERYRKLERRGENGVAARRQGSNLAMIQLFKIGP